MTHTPIAPWHPTAEFIATLESIQTTAGYDDVFDLIHGFMGGELDSSTDDAMVTAIETHWSAGTTDDAMDELDMAFMEMENIPVIIAHYGSATAAWNAIVANKRPSFDDTSPAIVSAWDEITAAYDVDEIAERDACAILFGITADDDNELADDGPCDTCNEPDPCGYHTR